MQTPMVAAALLIVPLLVGLGVPAAAAHGGGRAEPGTLFERLLDVEDALDDAIDRGDLARVRDARRALARVRGSVRGIEPAGRAPMSAAARKALDDELARASWDGQRTAILRGLRADAFFTCEDVALLLYRFASDPGRVDALKALKDVVVDPQNRALLLARFDTESGKRAALDVWTPRA